MRMRSKASSKWPSIRPADLPEGMASLDHVLAHPTETTRAFIHDGRKAALIGTDL